MKLSTRLAVIVGIAILGLNVVALFALQTLHSTMLADRHEEIRAVLGLARQQVSMYQTQEKNKGNCRMQKRKPGPLPRLKAYAMASSICGPAPKMRWAWSTPIRR